MIKNQHKRTAIASVIFPANLKFFQDFLRSLNQQTKKDFDLVLFNDGCDERELNSYIKPFRGLRHYIVHTTRETPSEIRVELIEYIKSNLYDIIVFADTDDFFSDNRVALSVNELNNNADVVVNDLSIVSRDGKVIMDHIWGQRFSGLKIDLNFLMKQNVLGLSNTAINTKLLDFEIQFNRDINYFDWIFYLQIFFHGKNPKISKVDATTYYRQHESNTIGRNSGVTLEKLLNLWAIKDQIQETAQQIEIPNIQTYRTEHRLFKNKILNNKEEVKKHIIKLNNLENLFWFEEINQ